jgi:[ribosomal protein S5]-alanine N-acetyltransferase
MFASTFGRARRAPRAARVDNAPAMASAVHLREPSAEDATEFLALVAASRAFHKPWVEPPGDRHAFAALIRRNRGDDFQAYLVARRSDDAIVGAVDFSQILHGTFRNAYLGFYALGDHAGHGYMTAGVGLALGHAFTELGLHRVEANVQPRNERSKALLGRLGFRQEGFSPRYLKIGGRWRDHERWAILAEEWARRTRA